MSIVKEKAFAGIEPRVHELIMLTTDPLIQLSKVLTQADLYKTWS